METRDIGSSAHVDFMWNVSNEVHDKKTLETWQGRARLFKEFFAQVNDDHYFRGNRKAQFQAMFLGEKPAIFNHNLLANESDKDLLRKYGFKIAGNFIYDPGQVRTVIEQYPEIFKKFETTDPDEVMNLVSAAAFTEEHIVRGLVLGFPLESVQAYERTDTQKLEDVAIRLLELLDPRDKDFLLDQFFTEKIYGNQAAAEFLSQKLHEYQGRLGISDSDMPELLKQLADETSRQPANVYGVNWVDVGVSEESLQKQKRLKAAFDYSGIRNI